MDKEWLKRRLDGLRKERDWSKCRLNEEAGFSAGMVYQWYNTNRMPTIQNIETICKTCGITLAEFFADGSSEQERIADREFLGLYAKLTAEEKVFVRDLTEKLLTLTKNTHGRENQ